MLSKLILDVLTKAYKDKVREALQTLWDEIVKGQQMQIIKKDYIKELFDTYGVEYEK